MHKQIVKEATSDRKIKENIEIYIFGLTFLHICVCIHAQQGITAEFSSMQDILEKVKEIEDSL